MNLSPKYILTFFVFLVAFFGYNVWLVQRDNQMFDAYYGKQTLKEQYCSQLKNWHHPDCKVE